MRNISTAAILSSAYSGFGHRLRGLNLYDRIVSIAGRSWGSTKTPFGRRRFQAVLFALPFLILIFPIPACP